ncbi:hypothetical protein CcI49_25770 [Frankia sp. CcI49]|nr:hypothetical protein CcI49_25770 [Frankia sp. CcI49]
MRSPQVSSGMVPASNAVWYLRILPRIALIWLSSRARCSPWSFWGSAVLVWWEAMAASKIVELL